MSPRKEFRAPGAGGDPQAVARPGPDVSTGQVIGAGYVSESIETNRWYLTDRERNEYRSKALGVAEGLGFTPAIPPEEQAAAAMGAPVARGNPAARELETILAARRANPGAFEGVPVTEEEIEAAVTADLKAQYEDARRTIELAPDTILGRTVPAFTGAMGAAMSDEVNLPLAALSMGAGSGLSFGRMLLMEGALGATGEAMTLPKQFSQSERLGIPEPNPVAQIALGGAAGVAFPAAIVGGARAVGAGRRVVTNSALVRQYRERAGELTAEQRAAVNRVEAAEAERTVNPAANPNEASGAIDQAVEDMATGRPPDAGPAPDPDRATALTTPREPDAPAPEADTGTGRTAAPAEPRGVVENLQSVIRDAEASGSYDIPSSYTVIAPPKPLTEMSLNEIDAWQAANQNAGAASTASGAYQIIRSTLQSLRNELNLSGNEIFRPELQDRLATALLERRGLRDFQAGRITADQFADRLAQEWAALPLITGRSYYAGDMLNAATIDRDTIIGILGGQSYTQTGKPPPTMTRFPASGLLVDARTYQFRTEVDAEGVGTALDRVTQWDEMLAGDMIVHERLDGARYIADGHHRRQLAHRLEASGHPPIMVNGFILREADGFTVDDVRAIAAVKNIEAGSATAIDAAKVLRIDPAMLEKLSLRQSHVRDARGLMKLNDESFDMVTNGQISESHAAVVGDMTADPDMQRAVMRVLLATKPKSIAEARQVAADAYRLGLEKASAASQTSLFGDDWDVQETLFKERAKVMARALTQLRNDRRVFQTLVRESDRIEGAGNVLTAETNANRADVDATALALIERLVNRAGPLDDALTDAARRLRGGERIGAASDEFLESVRSAIEAGDLNRLLDGGDGSARAAPEAGAGAGEGPGDGTDPRVTEAAERLREAVELRERLPDDAPPERWQEATDAVKAARAELDELVGREQGEAVQSDIEDAVFAALEREGAAAGDMFGSEATPAGEQLVTPGTRPVSDADRLAAAAAAPMRGRSDPADAGLFDVGARDQTDMFSDAGRDPGGALGDMFGDPSPDAPAPRAQADAAESAIRAALDAGEDLEIPTGRTIDGEAEVMTMRDIMADLDDDAEFLGALDACK